jgi:hypothetical protein
MPTVLDLLLVLAIPLGLLELAMPELLLPLPRVATVPPFGELDRPPLLLQKASKITSCL